MSNYNIKSIKKEFKAKGIFYTTNELAVLMKSFVDIDTTEVYDPTCGDGALLSVFDDNIKKYGQEIVVNYSNKFIEAPTYTILVALFCYGFFKRLLVF